jgi:predicted transcriptional regulator
MKAITFKYRPNNKKKSFADMEKAIAGKPQIFSNTVFFENLDLIDSFINSATAQIIVAIKKHCPQSVDELVKILDKDNRDIQNKVNSLVGLGILEIESDNDAGLSRSVPKVLYDKFIIDLDETDEKLMAV